MNHLILCREYPPAPYPAGGIGTYARHMANLLAEAGDTVHVIAQRSELAPNPLHTEANLTIHRLSLEEPIADNPTEAAEQARILRLLAFSDCPTHLFAWQAARYIERLLLTTPIDVIEAQEWEAPLYYLLARRLAGLAQGLRPPCIVHLHSPTQMIFEHNDWDQTLTDFAPIVRMEAFTIRHADRLLCPSRYLAAQVEQRCALPPATIEVIPYAMGLETPVLPRTPEAWASDAITYVGRLELRKGVIEWIDAAISVARTHPTVSFDFFGADTSLGGGAGRSVLAALRARIPRALRPRFRFHGACTRTQLLHALSQASIAVVPSRWENFPFTCIEAMASGLPVLASPNGGMAEMITDNHSGWIASSQSASDLAQALHRALATPPATRATMGAQAATTICLLCNNATIATRQQAFRAEVAATQRSPTISADRGNTPSPKSQAAHIFQSNPTIRAILPWTLYGPHDLDPGPSNVLPPNAILRPNPTPAATDLFTYPGPPILQLPPRHRPRRRYSGMALIINQSAAFAFHWFLGAPLEEKFRWLARVAANPRRLANWAHWRLRSLGPGKPEAGPN